MKTLLRLSLALWLAVLPLRAAEINDLDVTDNNNVVRFPEGMTFANVNNSARALEGILARWYKDVNGALTTAGSSNAYTASANQVLTAYYSGLWLKVKASFTNTGAATVNVDSLGAKALKKGGTTDVAAGDIVQDRVYDLVYDGTNFQVLGADAVRAGNPNTFSATNTFSAAQAFTSYLELSEMAAPSAPGADKVRLYAVDQGGISHIAAKDSAGNVMLLGNQIADIKTWPLATVPAGWLECNGAAVSRTTYAALFAVLGTTYGVGDGSTTFALPDLRGEFVRGWDHGKGSDPNAGARTSRGDGTTGDNVGTKQADEFRLHGHPFRTGDGSVGTPNGDGGLQREGANNNNYPAFTGAVTGTSGQQIGGSGGSETRPRNVNMMYVIKF